MFGIGAFCSGLKDMVCDIAEAAVDTMATGVEKVLEVADEVMETTFDVADTIMEKTGIDYAIDKTIELTESAGKAMATNYKKFSGQAKYEEAKDLLEDLQIKKEKAEKSYKEYISKVTKNIKKNIEKLNTHRKKLKEVNFEKFTTLVSMFAEWDIDPVLQEKLTEIKQKNLIINLNKDDLFDGIDFDEHALRENCLAILTLGIYTRKKANQALENVKHQESVLNEEIARLEAEKIRLKLVEESLQQAVSYFASFHGLYENILSELEYSVNMLQGIYLLNKPFFFNGKIDPYYLPEKHLLCLMASEKMTRILHSMSKQRYISFNNKKQLIINKNEIKSVENNNKIVGELKIALSVA